MSIAAIYAKLSGTNGRPTRTDGLAAVSNAAALFLALVWHYVPRLMSRNTVLQLIAAVITIALLIVLHKGLDWLFNLMGVGFAMGFICGGLAVFLVWYLADREENSLAAGDIPSAEEQRTRHTIDL